MNVFPDTPLKKATKLWQSQGEQNLKEVKPSKVLFVLVVFNSGKTKAYLKMDLSWRLTGI